MIFAKKTGNKIAHEDEDKDEMLEALCDRMILTGGSKDYGKR